jgi:hypothetical protein
MKDALMAAVLENMRAQINEKIGAIRDTDTGEFPCAIDTSIWRSCVTICSALNLFFGMTQAPFHGPLPISWSRLIESFPAKIIPLGGALADEEVAICRTADRICSPTGRHVDKTAAIGAEFSTSAPS